MSLEAASSSGRTLFFNASVVHTVSPTAPSAAAWCVIDGAFSGVGSLAVATAACGASAARVNLHGAVVVPGLIDSHLHLLYGGLKLARPQLDNASSAAEVVSILLARFPGKVYPTREDLDGAFPHTPVWLGRIDGHAAWANSEALRRVPKLPKSDPQGGRIVRDPETGEPTGVFTDTAMRLVAARVPRPSRNESLSALRLALARLSRHGLTAIHDPGEV